MNCLPKQCQCINGEAVEEGRCSTEVNTYYWGYGQEKEICTEARIYLDLLLESKNDLGWEFDDMKDISLDELVKNLCPVYDGNRCHTCYVGYHLGYETIGFLLNITTY